MENSFLYSCSSFVDIFLKYCNQTNKVFFKICIASKDFVEEKFLCLLFASEKIIRKHVIAPILTKIPYLIKIENLRDKSIKKNAEVTNCGSCFFRYFGLVQLKPVRLLKIFVGLNNLCRDTGEYLKETFSEELSYIKTKKSETVFECCCTFNCYGNFTDYDDPNTEREINAFVYEEPSEVKTFSPLQLYGLQGDTKRELFRLTTFKNFPNGTCVDFPNLAKAGFYYTETGHLVKCFSCSNVTDALASSNPFDHDMHRPNCAMVSSMSCDNIPLNSINGNADSFNVNLQTNRNHAVQSVENNCNERNRQHNELLRKLDLRLETNRLKTFENWPRHLSKPDPSDLAHSGFFYLGNDDRTQCFSCGGVLRNWSVSDNVPLQHLRLFSNCKMAQGRDHNNVENEHLISQTSQGNRFQLTNSQQFELSQLFLCANPLNPQMSSLERRIQTFSSWRFTYVTGDLLAKAGFFSTGDQDKTHCFYCNGGLQNWKFDDDPWIEHARWFPSCEYLLQQKGLDFVRFVTARYPNMNRPALRTLGKDVPPPQHLFNQGLLPSTSIQHNSESQQTTSSPDYLKSEIAKAVIGMGFDKNMVKQTIEKQVQVSGRPYLSTTALLDAVLFEEELHSSKSTPNNSSTLDSLQASFNNTAINDTTSSSNEEELKMQLEAILDERTCKVCLDRVADIVFLPCSHMCCCLECTKCLKLCPICRCKIERAIRTYTS